MNSAENTLAWLRIFCLSLPETTETDSWNHPNFKAGKLTFVAYEWIKKRPSIAFRLDPADHVAVQLIEDFFPTPYGKGKWISLWADEKTDRSFIEAMVLKSYRTVALKRMLKNL